MADSWYEVQRNSMLGLFVASFADLNTDDIRCMLRDEGADALNLADQDLADIAAGARIAVSSNLASKTVGTVAVGVFDHDDFAFLTVAGASVESIDYWKDTGVEATSPLIMNLDSATGLPLTPNGGTVTWSPHASGVVQVN